MSPKRNVHFTFTLIFAFRTDRLRLTSHKQAHTQHPTWPYISYTFTLSRDTSKAARRMHFTYSISIAFITSVPCKAVSYLEKKPSFPFVDLKPFRKEESDSNAFHNSCNKVNFHFFVGETHRRLLRDLEGLRFGFVFERPKSSGDSIGKP